MAAHRPTQGALRNQRGASASSSELLTLGGAQRANTLSDDRTLRDRTCEPDGRRRRLAPAARERGPLESEPDRRAL